ncbi:MAG: sortase [Actinomycetota bacterium]|nr:sortase [Actinomycetota bacterium]
MRFLALLGKFLISVGVGVLLFVVWTLWGTGIQTEREQDKLTDVFAAQPDFPDHKPGENPGPPPGFKPLPGEPIFRLKIPALRLNDNKGYLVVEGVDDDELALGPGHYPACRPGFEPPLCTEFDEVYPGEEGRAIVSGHRTTHGAPFWDLDKLDKGDEIITETKWGDFVYEVSRTEIVPAASTAIVVQKEGPAEIVLTTCHPKFSAAQRLIVYAEMTGLA